MGSFHVSGNLLNRVDEEFNGLAHAPTQSMPRHGVGWVLRWGAALAVLWLSGCVLAEFAYSLAAEHALSRAARAGALEATLPRATIRSVGDTVKRRLMRRASWTEQFTLSVHQNGAAVFGAIQATTGDQMTVTLAVPLRAVLPRWLNVFSLRTSASRMEVRAERDVPGRFL